MLEQIEILRIRLNNLMARVFARLDTLENNAANATFSNITEGTLNTATTNRTVDLGTKDLQIVTQEGTLELRRNDTSGNFSGVIANNDYVDLIGTNSTLSSIGRFRVDNSGIPTMVQSSGQYRFGTTSSTVPRQIGINDVNRNLEELRVDKDFGYLYSISNDPYHVTETALSPAVASQATVDELKTFVNNLPQQTRSLLKGRFIFYTGDDLTSSDPLIVLYRTSNGTILDLKSGSSTEKSLLVGGILSGTYTTADALIFVSPIQIERGSKITYPVNNSTERTLDEGIYKITLRLYVQNTGGSTIVFNFVTSNPFVILNETASIDPTASNTMVELTAVIKVVNSGSIFNIAVGTDITVVSSVSNRVIIEEL